MNSLQIFKIGVYCPDNLYLSKARTLSQKLEIPFLGFDSLGDQDFILEVGEKVGLRLSHEEKVSPLVVDFGEGALDFRRRYGGKGGQPILKAIGGAKKKILDCTAGLGRDSFILASFDCEVLALEKSPIVACLVLDALERAARHDGLKFIVKRLNYEVKNALDFLEKSSTNEFDAIYLDPMFPAKTKTALPKKDLRILQLLLANENNNIEAESQNLLALAKKKARRVVVKRPQNGKPIADGVSIEFAGSSTRFDVYLS